MRALRWMLLAALPPLVFAIACLPEEERTKYGGPEGLAGRELPKPADASFAGPGGPGGALDGGTAGICDGGTDPPDGAGCAVSWTNDIYAYIKGPGKCGDTGCHLPQNPRAAGQQPPIDPNNGDDTYNELVQYTSSKFAGRRYIDVCSTVPENSAIKCNLTEISPGKAACDPLMPQTTTGAQPPDTTFLTNLDAWLKCGAPKN